MESGGRNILEIAWSCKRTARTPVCLRANIMLKGTGEAAQTSLFMPRERIVNFIP